MVEWMIRGPEIANCNCAYGCPCQFNALPTDGTCRAAVAMRIDEGHFGDVRLDGLKWVAIAAWPGPIHMGHGEIQPVLDVRATEEQRAALLTIMSGAETDPGATFFNVFMSMIDTVHEPMFREITFEADVDNATAHFRVEDLVEGHTEPIRNPVTGEPHHVRVVLRKGFEFAEAEFGSSTTRTLGGPIELGWQGRHAHLNKLHMNGHGIVR